MVFVLATLVVLPHQQMHPVLIGKTGLGLWESVADVRHLSTKQRIYFAEAVHEACKPDVDETTDYGKATLREYAVTSRERCKALIYGGRLIEDYWFFDTHREALTKHANARGISLLYDSDN